MDIAPARSFFLQPSSDRQRLYEAFRAVCVEGCRQKDIAERFGYDYAAFRQQVSRFRARCALGQPSPFSSLRLSTTHHPHSGRKDRPKSQPSPIAAC